MLNRQQQLPLCLVGRLLLVAGFKSTQACFKRWLQHPLDHKLLIRQPCWLKKHRLASQPLRTSSTHPVLPRPDVAVRYIPPMAAPLSAGAGNDEGGGTAPALQRLLGSPRQEPVGSMGTGLLCAQGEGRHFRQMPPEKIAVGIARQGEDLL